MIMNNKKVGHEEGSWEMFEMHMKMKTFLIMHHLIANNIINDFLHCVFYMIENLQMLYFSFHPVIYFMWKNEWIDKFTVAIRYFGYNYALSVGGPQFFVTILYTSFGLVLFLLIYWFYLCYRLKEKDVHTPLTTMMILQVKFFSGYAQLFYTVMTLPLFNIFLSTLWCKPSEPINQGLQCYSGIYGAHLTFAAIGFTITLVFSIIYTVLFVDYNPTVKSPFTGLLSVSNYLRLAQKISLPFLFIFNSGGYVVKESISLVAVLHLIIIWMRFKEPPIFNKAVFWFQVICDTILLWLSCTPVIVIVINFIDPVAGQKMGFFHMFLAIPVILAGVMQAFQSKHNHIMTQQIKHLRNEQEIDFYIVRLWELIEKHEHDQLANIYLNGMLRIHYSGCVKTEECCCKKLIKRDFSQEEESFEVKRDWNCLFRNSIEETIERYPKCARFHLFYAYVSGEKLLNPYKALFELMMAEDSKPAVREEFSMYRYKNTLEQRMIEIDIQDQQLDVNQIVEFQNHYVILQGNIEKSVNLHLEFWRELSEDNPNVSKLQNLGGKIEDSVSECNGLFETLMEINSTNLKCMEVYTYYLLDVVNNEDLGFSIKERCKQLMKTTTQRSMIEKGSTKFNGFAEATINETAIITVSGNHNSMGIVIGCNNEIVDLLEFYQSDLVDQNINRLMPKVIADTHDFLMKRFLETSSAKVIGYERLVFAQNKNGYLVPVHILVKVLPNLNKGIQLVGFLKPRPTPMGQHFVMYDANTFQVYGITESFYASFGVSSDFIFGGQTNQEFFLEYAFKELQDQLSQENSETYLQQLRGMVGDPTGVSTVVDTMQLPQMYLQQEDKNKDNDDQNESEQDEGSGFQNLFNRQKAKILLIDDKNFGETQIHVIMVSEYDQNAMENPQRSLEKFEKKVRASKVMSRIAEEFHRESRNLEQFFQNESNQQKRKSNQEVIKEEAEQEEQDDFQVNQIQLKSALNDQPVQQSGHFGSGADVDSMNERIQDKTLKEFKAVISQRDNPKQVRHLKCLAILLIASLLALSISNLVIGINQGNFLKEGITAIKDTHQRHSLMADINLYCRLLELLGTGRIKTDNQTNLETQFQSNLTVMVDELQSIQFNVITESINLQSRSGVIDPSSTIQWPVTFLLQSNQSKIYYHNLNDGLFQYITSASAIRKATLQSFFQSDQIESTGKNFYFVRENGLFILRYGSELIAQQFFDYYSGQLQSVKNNGLVIMIVGVVLTFIIVTTFLPILFGLKHDNREVMSFFGMVPTDDIKDLINKADEYLKEFIEKYSDKKEENDEEEQIGLSPSISMKNKVKEKENQEIENQGEVPIIDAEPMQDPASGSPKADKEKVRLFESTHKEKSQKLLDAKGEEKTSTILYFFLGGSILMIEYIIIFILVNWFADSMNLTFQHLHYCAKRPSVLKYDLLFMLEEITVQNVTYQENLMSSYYNDQLYQNEQILFETLTLSYPPQLDSYINYFYQLNYHDICSSLNWTNNLMQITDGYIFFTPSADARLLQTLEYTPSQIIQECLNSDGQTLRKGLRTSVYLQALNSAQLRNVFYSSNNSSDMSDQILNGPNLQEIFYFMKFIVPSMRYSNDLLYNSVVDYINYQNGVQIYNFLAFIGCIIFIYIIFWNPYLNRLKELIWRTKGMLSIIPISIIQRTQNLKDGIERKILNLEKSEEY